MVTGMAMARPAALTTTAAALTVTGTAVGTEPVGMAGTAVGARARDGMAVGGMTGGRETTRGAALSNGVVSSKAHGRTGIRGEKADRLGGSEGTCCGRYTIKLLQTHSPAYSLACYVVTNSGALTQLDALPCLQRLDVSACLLALRGRMIVSSTVQATTWCVIPFSETPQKASQIPTLPLVCLPHACRSPFCSTVSAPPAFPSTLLMIRVSDSFSCHSVHQSHAGTAPHAVGGKTVMSAGVEQLPNGLGMLPVNACRQWQLCLLAR